MLKEALNRFVDLCRSQAATIEPFDQEGRRFVRIFRPDTGEVEFVDLPAKPICVQVEGFASLQHAYELYKPGEVLCRVEEELIELVFDPSATRDSRDRILSPLPLSPIFNLLSRGIRGNPKSLVHSLKFDLFEATITPEVFMDAVSKLKFETEQTSEAQTDATTDAVSASVKNKVTGAGNLPEVITIAFEPYPGLPVQPVAVKALVRPDFDAGQLAINPFPGELRRVKLQARQEICEILSADHGIPEGSIVIC